MMIIVQKIQFIRRNWKLVTEKNTTQTRTLKVEILEKILNLMTVKNLITLKTKIKLWEFI